GAESPGGASGDATLACSACSAWSDCRRNSRRFKIRPAMTRYSLVRGDRGLPAVRSSAPRADPDSGSCPRVSGILSGDRGGGLDDVPFAVGHEEITVRNPHRSHVAANENVHPVVALPQVADFHALQVTRLAQGVHHLLADRGAPVLLLIQV